VASKIEEMNEDQTTRFVMLLNKPQNFYEAKGLARSIINDKDRFTSVNKSQAYIMNTTRRELNSSLDNWGRFIAFPSLNLLEFVKDLIAGECFREKIPITRLGKIADIGIDWKTFTGYFRKSNVQLPGSHPTIYSGKEELKKTMLSKFNKFIVPKSARAENTFRERSSCLLVPDRIWIPTSHVISILTPSETFSNVYYAVKLRANESQQKYKSLCCWLNSTFGLLLILSNRSETRPGWTRLKVANWKVQHVLDINSLGGNVINSMASVFDKYCNDEMLRLSQQYNPEEIDSRRLAFDKEVLHSLGISVKDNQLYELYRYIHESFNQWFVQSQIRNQE